MKDKLIFIFWILMIIFVFGSCFMSINRDSFASKGCKNLDYTHYEIEYEGSVFGEYTIYCYNLPDENGEIIKLGTFE